MIEFVLGLFLGSITGYLCNKEIHIEVKYDGKEKENGITKSKKKDG